jgi:hypothetical protein
MSTDSGGIDDRPEVQGLFAQIKVRIPGLEALFGKCNDE